MSNAKRGSNPGKTIEDDKQISVDAGLQIIVGQHISQHANDKQEIEPALTALHDTVEQLPLRLSVDNGYWSGANLQTLEQKGVDAYMATDKGEKPHKKPLEASERKLVKADFEYHEAANIFTCPAGQTLARMFHKFA